MAGSAPRAGLCRLRKASRPRGRWCRSTRSRRRSGKTRWPRSGRSWTLPPRTRPARTRPLRCCKVCFGRVPALRAVHSCHPSRVHEPSYICCDASTTCHNRGASAHTCQQKPDSSPNQGSLQTSRSARRTSYATRPPRTACPLKASPRLPSLRPPGRPSWPRWRPWSRPRGARCGRCGRGTARSSRRCSRRRAASLRGWRVSTATWRPRRRSARPRKVCAAARCS